MPAMPGSPRGPAYARRAQATDPPSVTERGRERSAPGSQSPEALARALHVEPPGRAAAEAPADRAAYFAAPRAAENAGAPEPDEEVRRAQAVVATDAGTGTAPAAPAA